MSEYERLRQSRPRMLHATLIIIEHDDEQGLLDGLAVLSSQPQTRSHTSTGSENPQHFTLKAWTYPSPGGLRGRKYERAMAGYSTKLVRALRDWFDER